MKYVNLILVGVLFLGLAGCSSDGSPTEPPKSDEWSFPANSSKFAVTVYSGKTSVAVGEAFDVKVVLYNVSNVFGAAVDLMVPQDTLEVADAVEGPIFPATVNPLIVGVVDSAARKVSYGISLRAGSTAAFSGSGVLFKLQLKALRSGPFTLRIVPQTLELKNSLGQPITNFATIAKENLAMTAN